jgi:hypothetical protein
MKSKLITWCVCILAWWAPTSLRSAEAFQGAYVARVLNSHGRETTAKFAVQPDVVRFEATLARGGGVTVLIDRKTGVQRILMPERKSFATKPAGAKESGAARAAGTLEETGDHQRLLDLDCRKYVFRQGEAVTEIWATDGIGALPVDFQGNVPPKPGSWEEALAAKGLFPLKSATTKAGNAAGSVEVTEVKRGALPEQLFKIPSGWNDVSHQTP